MLTTRVYRPARPAHEALSELHRMAGIPVLPALRGRARGDRGDRDRPRRAGARAAARRLPQLSISVVLAHSLIRSTILGGGAEASIARSTEIDPQALAEFQAGIRRRYSDEQILEELRASRRAPRALADDEGVRGGPAVAGAPADGDRALRHVERGEAGGRADAAPVRHARGAGRAAAAARRRARADADRRRHQAAPRDDAVGVALLAHVRVAHDGSARGRLRRAGGGGAARAGDRPGLRARTGGSAGCRSSATGRPRGGPTSRC